MRCLAILAAFFFIPPALAAPALNVRVHDGGAMQSVRPGTQRVPALRLTFAAACSAPVTVSSVAVERRGAGESDDIAGVYALEGARRVSRRVAVNRDGTIRIPLQQFVVEPCGERSFLVAYDLAADADVAGEHSFAFQEVAADGRVTVQHIPSRTIRSAGPSAATVSVTYADVPQPLRYGAQRILSRVRLKAEEDDALLGAITFTNDGSARDTDLQNLYLESSRGDRLSEIVLSLDGDSVRIPLRTPKRLDRNAEKTYLLRGDIRASRRRTIRFLIDEPADIEVR